MAVRCAASGCSNTREGGRIFARCNTCNTWWCSKHGTKGNRCPGCGHRYLEGASGSGSGCFITTATLQSLGKDDNCEELQIFRNFRDNWLLAQPNGKRQIEEYYKIAPKIVSAIDNSSDKKEAYSNLWMTSILPCLECINQGHFEMARNIYLETVNDLKKKYMPT